MPAIEIVVEMPTESGKIHFLKETLGYYRKIGIGTKARSVIVLRRDAWLCVCYSFKVTESPAFLSCHPTKQKQD